MNRLALGHVGKGGCAHDFQSGFMDASEQEPGPARLLVGAVLATRVGGLAQAGQRCDRAIDGAHHGEEIDISGFMDQLMPPILPDLAPDDPAIAQLEQDEFEEFVGDMLLRCDRSG